MDRRSRLLMREYLRMYRESEGFLADSFNQERLFADDVEQFRNDTLLIRQDLDRLLAELDYPPVPALNPQIHFEKLKRVKYDDIKDTLSHDECSICIYPFNEKQEENLIYLPCSKAHIFHETCILEWLKRSSNCPL